ncbi:Uncharacterized protein TCM_006274 [Theobroma cacao]|uniref:Uncharacterized protein n=1 Tax=Theobroma cacao TaxID=3641 RepID=A0A061DX05_THECC|nr:Uncharacterized protein TCM_006274 [Theobroma cacao]
MARIFETCLTRQDKDNGLICALWIATVKKCWSSITRFQVEKHLLFVENNGRNLLAATTLVIRLHFTHIQALMPNTKFQCARD